MIRRLWYVLSWPWSLLVLYGGTTRAHGITRLDIWIAAFPWLAGVALALAARFIVTGSIRGGRPRY